MPTRLLLLLLLCLTTAACGARPCDDCFSIEVGMADGSWGACCTYTRDDAEDPLLLRFTRTAGEAYTAGIAAGCAWDPESPPFAPGLVTVDGREVDGLDGFGIDFEGPGSEAIVSIDCDPARPPPQWPDTILSLIDDQLASQFDPEAVAGEAVLVITPDIEGL